MIFLSHSWQNKPVAHKVVEALATERLPCWLDEQQLDYGAELRASLRFAISQSDIYLYLVSDAANNSAWVRDELEYAVGLEFEKKLKIVVPVRVADNEDELPPLLSGRYCATLDPTSGGAGLLAHNLTKISGCARIPENCRLSATVRLDKHRLVHTLTQARDFPTDSEIRALLLDDQYKTLDSLYWKVAEVRFPSVQGPPQELTNIAQIVAEIHRQSRSIIQEARLICRRFSTINSTDDYHQYFDAGHERALRVMLHRLQWNTTYLRSLREGEILGEDFVNARRLPEPFNGHGCDFVSEGQLLGSFKVPEGSHPFSPNMTDLIPWGLTSPFADMLPSDVGTAVGEILALRFMNQSLPSAEMHSPELLKYGLAKTNPDGWHRYGRAESR